MHKIIGGFLLGWAGIALFMAFLGYSAAVDGGEKFLRQNSELFAVASSVDAARLATTCRELRMEPPTDDPDSIQRWVTRAQHTSVQRMLHPHLAGWGGTAGILLLCGTLLLHPPRKPRV